MSYEAGIEAAADWVQTNGYVMHRENIGRLIAAFLGEVGTVYVAEHNTEFRRKHDMEPRYVPLRPKEGT